MNNIRGAGAKLVFIDLRGDSGQIQIFSSAAEWKGEKDYADVHRTVKRGDIIGVRGVPGRTKTGEFSIKSSDIQQLSYCLHILPHPPTNIHTLNKDTRFRQRYLDLIVNPQIQKKFKVRSQIVNYIRNYLI